MVDAQLEGTRPFLTRSKNQPQPMKPTRMMMLRLGAPARSDSSRETMQRGKEVRDAELLEFNRHSPAVAKTSARQSRGPILRSINQR
jgi:hypothetical protein